MTLRYSLLLSVWVDPSAEHRVRRRCRRRIPLSPQNDTYITVCLVGINLSLSACAERNRVHLKKKPETLLTAYDVLVAVRTGGV